MVALQVPLFPGSHPRPEHDRPSPLLATRTADLSGGGTARLLGEAGRWRYRPRSRGPRAEVPVTIDREQVGADRGGWGVFDWTVPGYRGIRELGHGSTGRTVIGVHEASGLPVTVRFLPSDPAEQAAGDAWTNRLADYRDDARVLAGIRSPQVAPLYEYMETDHGAATVREYVDGASVRQIVGGSGLRPESALALLQAGLLGLAAAHAHGVTHRRYRPENLLVDQQGAARVTDFAVTARQAPVAEDAESPDASSWIMDAEAVRADVRVAYTTFLTCLAGREPEPADAFSAGRLPRKLRPLAEPAAAGDGGALLAAVAAVGRAVNRDWAGRAAADLASRVAKVRPRRER